MKGRLILVDGSSYIYRAFHALPPLTTSNKEPSGAVFGTISMLKKLLSDSSPEDRVIVVLDSPTPTFRHQLDPNYKANRLRMPEELQAQIPAIQAIIQGLGLPLIIHPGVEADDIIGTLANQARKAGISTVISTNDKDFAQLVDDSTTLINAMTGVVLDQAGVYNRFQVHPEQMIDYLALMGDASDNVKGVPLVGPKTAVKWLTKYHTLENLLANTQHIIGKVGENLRASKEIVALAKALITIKQDVPLTENLEALLEKSQEIDFPSLVQWYERLEFKSWLQELRQSETLQRINVDQFKRYELVDNLPCLHKWLEWVEQSDQLVIDLETTSLDTLTAKIVGIGLGLSLDKVAYIPVAHNYVDTPVQLSCDTVLAALKPYLESKKLKKIGHNLKYDFGVLRNYNIQLDGLYADTLLEAYLVDSTRRTNDLDSLAFEYFNYKPITYESLTGKGKTAIPFNQVPIEQAATYTAEDISICLALHQTFEPKLALKQQLSLRDEIEIPLVAVLSHLERTGVRVNASLLAKHSQYLATRLLTLESKIYELAGTTFNIASPQQLQAILYEQHQLPVFNKTTKGQASTSEKVLKALESYHPLPGLILEYRALSKLKSTYTDALPKQLHPVTQRIHTAYHQAVVVTGRLSSAHPNLQNIPVKTVEGRKIRQAFEAAAGYRILSVDYSQIELRIMAHFSEDKTLLKAFANNEDIHVATASVLFNVPFETVTRDQRRQAKAINFGLMYGMSPFGLTAQLQISQASAQEIVSQYFERYPGVKKYMDETRTLAYEQGYVMTLFGRQLPLPMIRSQNRTQQKAAERAAINAPLQGTAADIIKRAMISTHNALTQLGLNATMIMQVHDELVFEVKEEHLSQATACIVQCMEAAAELKVPLRVSVGVGSNWDEAH